MIAAGWGGWPKIDPGFDFVPLVTVALALLFVRLSGIRFTTTRFTATVVAGTLWASLAGVTGWVPASAVLLLMLLIARKTVRPTASG
jgi:hypothetical protein